jgi:hypothetical protein
MNDSHDSLPPEDAALPDDDADAAAFDPVPLRYRRDGWTPDKQRRYVALLFKTGLAAEAARAVGMTQRSATRLRRRPEGAAFDSACRAAHRAARARWKRLHEEEARSRMLGRSAFFLRPLGKR